MNENQSQLGRGLEDALSTGRGEAFSVLGLRAGGERLISLFMTVGRLLSEKGDMNAALDTLLYYMKKELGVAKAMVSLIHGDSGKLFLSRSAGLGREEEEAIRDSFLSGEGALAKRGQVPHLGPRPFGGYSGKEAIPGLGGEQGLTLVTVPITREGKALGAMTTLSHFPDPLARKRHETHLSVMASLFSGEARLYMEENIDRVVLEKKVRTLSSEIYELKERYSPSNLVSCSAAMQEVYFLLRKVASRKTIVLILGEKGVEKETVAQSIHYDGLKAMGPFVMINCAEFPPEHLEAELLGPAAAEGSEGPGPCRGLLGAADGGSIFIDEIDRCPLGLQARLLDALQEPSQDQALPPGPLAPDARVIAGTCRDLREMVAEGLFLEALFYRLNVFPITIPPLRKREEDIPRLARHFLGRYNEDAGKNLKTLSPMALEILRAYDWPGNVEELEAVIHRTVIMADKKAQSIEPQDLPLHIKLVAAPKAAEPLGLEERLSSIEHEMISEALKRHRGNISKAAKDLRLTRRSMGLRMKRLNLNYKDFRS
ncbi:MAG: sigma 54-interacting transcriptional regulator [Deltaproteobacteria bacterium]|nr:sigma 54-interacting transcriptional regulator [Deltaproteobacteria bacterium]